MEGSKEREFTDLYFGEGENGYQLVFKEGESYISFESLSKVSLQNLQKFSISASYGMNSYKLYFDTNLPLRYSERVDELMKKYYLTSRLTRSEALELQSAIEKSEPEIEEEKGE